MLPASQTQLNAVTATKIASSNLERRSVAVKNLDTTNTVYVGAPSVTALTGFPLAPGDSVSFEGHPADVFAIAGAGTPTVAVVEGYGAAVVVPGERVLPDCELEWLSGDTDPTPQMRLSVPIGAMVEGDSWEIRFYSDAGLTTQVAIASGTVNGTDAGDGEIDDSLSSLLPDGTIYARGRVLGKTAWSNTESLTIDAAPVMTSATTGNIDEGEVLAFTLAAHQSCTFAITGGADQGDFEISGSTLRWTGNGVQDYESPNDADTNNSYIVEVTPTAIADSEVGSAQTITITVDNVEGDGFEAESELIFAAFTTPPSDPRKEIINTFVAALKNDGIWTKLDCLYVFAANDSQAALINWKAPGTFDATLANAPTFTQDRGFTGNGSNASINSNFTPSTAGGVYVQDSAHISGRALNNLAASNANQLFGNAAALTHRSNASIRDGGGNVGLRINSSGSASAGANGNTNGHFVVNRSGASAVQVYEDGAVFNGSVSLASTGLPTQAIIFGADVQSSLWSSLQIASASIGSSLTAGEVADLYAAELVYMQAVGAV